MASDIRPDDEGVGGGEGMDRRISQTDVVVQGITQMIQTGELLPGGRLPTENDLAAKLGVSRGSLREAVRALSIMGVLETRQGAGTFVTALDASLLLSPMSFVVDLQQGSHSGHTHSVRRTLEIEAVGRAALRIGPDELHRARQILQEADEGIVGLDHEAVLEADMAFHRLIARASGNPVLAALIEALSSRTVRGRMWRAIADENADRSTALEHRAILHALESGDPDAARIRMSGHLLGVESFLVERPPVDGD